MSAVQCRPDITAYAWKEKQRDVYVEPLDTPFEVRGSTSRHAPNGCRSHTAKEIYYNEYSFSSPEKFSNTHHLRYDGTHEHNVHVASDNATTTGTCAGEPTGYTTTNQRFVAHLHLDHTGHIISLHNPFRVQETHMHVQSTFHPPSDATEAESIACMNSCDRPSKNVVSVIHGVGSHLSEAPQACCDTEGVEFHQSALRTELAQNDEDSLLHTPVPSPVEANEHNTYYGPTDCEGAPTFSLPTQSSLDASVSTSMQMEMANNSVLDSTSIEHQKDNARNVNNVVAPGRQHTYETHMNSSDHTSQDAVSVIHGFGSHLSEAPLACFDTEGVEIHQSALPTELTQNDEDSLLHTPVPSPVEAYEHNNYYGPIDRDGAPTFSLPTQSSLDASISTNMQTEIANNSAIASIENQAKDANGVSCTCFLCESQPNFWSRHGFKLHLAKCHNAKFVNGQLTIGCSTRTPGERNELRYHNTTRRNRPTKVPVRHQQRLNARQCTICANGHNYDWFGFRAHMRQRHPSAWMEIQEMSRRRLFKDSNFRCVLCNAHYKRKFALRQHLHSFHGVDYGEESSYIAEIQVRIGECFNSACSI